jgi:hypothetical protein
MRKLFYYINRLGFNIKNYWLFSLKMRNFDYGYILMMMQHQLEILDRHMKRDALTEDHSVKEREKAIELLARINDPHYDYGLDSWQDVERMENRDWEELFTILKEHMREWWD